jgi:HAD superfamily hydrolase (TIGR01509 family)
MMAKPLSRQTTEAAIFDMDGVLIDSGVHHRAAWQALLTELGEEPAHPEYWRLTIGRPSEEAVPLLLGRSVPDHEARRLARRKRDLYVNLSRAGVVSVPGVRDFVAALSRLGIPRAVGTSASRFDLDRHLVAVGLRRHFDVIVTADDVALGKPDPEVYELAAARLRVPPEACIVFEDSLVGVEAARRAGMRAVGVTTAHSETELREAGAERTSADFEGLEWTSLAAG